MKSGRPAGGGGVAGEQAGGGDEPVWWPKRGEELTGRLLCGGGGRGRWRGRDGGKLVTPTF
jgi:hypothetical protein